MDEEVYEGKIVIAPLLHQPNNHCLFRADGTEVIITYVDNKTMSTRQLKDVEKKAFKRYIKELYL